MSNILQLVENEQTSEFYPTPKKLIDKMLQGVDFRYIQTVLEPSAGKGDILRELTQRYNGRNLDIDCVEIDANLRQILKYNFSKERECEISSRIGELERLSRCWNSEKREWENHLTEKQKIELSALKDENRTFFKNGIHIIHNDFLTLNPFKQYDLIIMNPPFSNGDKHLLKALKLQEKGGNIICLLNAETIKNPYTDTRRELLKQLNNYNAQIEFIENAFVSAERSTGVEVALIKVNIPKVQEESDIFERMRKAENVEDFESEATDLEVADFIKALVSRFNVEVRAGLELIRQYTALKPYIMNSFDSAYQTAMIEIKVTPNEYLKNVRRKYWQALLSNQKFVGKLTSKLQSEYHKKVSEFSNYDFTEFNIYTLQAEMNTQIKRGIEDEIIVMFDRLTQEHSYYPECQKNRHYYDGWKTNKAHKIDKKVIIPCYGVFSHWDGMPRVYEAKKVLADIERILNFFAGQMTAEVNSDSFLEYNFNQGITKNIKQKFYTVTFYKKGTAHLTFNCPELIERFNIYAAQNKKWLPPCYGKKQYNDMTAEEKQVIDSFQGEQAYNEVLAKADYYLAPVTNNQLLMLTE